MSYTPAYSNFFNSNFYNAAPYSSSFLSQAPGSGGPQNSIGPWNATNSSTTGNSVYGSGSYNVNFLIRRGEVADAVSAQLSMFLNSSYSLMTSIDTGATWGSLSYSTVSGYGTTISSLSSTVSSHGTSISTNTSNISANTSSISSTSSSLNNLTVRVDNIESTVTGLTAISSTSGGIRVKP